MSTKKGKAMPVDREIPDGTAIISVVHPEGNPKGVTVEETVIKDNTTQCPDIGTNVGEALEKALQKSSDPKPSKTKTNQEANKMEEKKTATATNTETTNAKVQPKAETKQPKVEQKPEAAPATPAQQKAEQQPAAAEAKPQQLSDMIAELKTLKEGLAAPTRVEVEHRRDFDTGAEAKHQFLVGLATGAGVALGVTVVTTAAWLIQRKLSGGNDSSAE